jgi:phage shock protein PspC (stress-responsive transcriptional regulator)
VVLFWGIAWIVLGISDRKIRVRVIKILIGIVGGFALLIIFALICGLIMDSFSKPPTSLAPQSYEEHREIAPTTLPRLQFLEELEKKLKDKGEERHKPKPGGDGRR